MFGRKKKAGGQPAFPPEDYEPVIRCSICTGEQVACMRNRHTCHFQELMLLRTPDDLEAFCRQYQVAPDQIKKVY